MTLPNLTVLDLPCCPGERIRVCTYKYKSYKQLCCFVVLDTVIPTSSTDCRTPTDMVTYKQEIRSAAQTASTPHAGDGKQRPNDDSHGEHAILLLLYT